MRDANGGYVRTTETSDGDPPENGENMLAIRPFDYQQTVQSEPKETWNGVVYYRSEVNMRQITDGGIPATSNSIRPRGRIFGCRGDSES